MVHLSLAQTARIDIEQSPVNTCILLPASHSEEKIVCDMLVDR